MRLAQLVMGRGRAVSGGTIADYFASGERGFWVNPADLTSMKQDSAGTTAVTATGQSVGLINDLSGNGHHHSQATSGKRPVLQQDGDGKYYLQFTPASSQFLMRAAESTLAPGNDSLVVIAGVQFDSVANNPVHYSRSVAAGVNGRYWAQSNSTGTMSGWYNSNLVAVTDESAAVPTGTKHIVTLVADRVSGSVALRVDGVAASPTAFTPDSGTNLTPSIKSRIGAYGDASDSAETTNYMSGRIYGLVTRLTPTIDLGDVASMEAAMAAYVHP